jgi:hypothetical protein
MKKPITPNLIPVTDVRYVKWIHKEEDLSYIGLVIAENDTHISIATKVGEITLSKDDGEFIESTQHDFDKIKIDLPIPEPTPITKTNVRTGSRTEQAAEIINQMSGANKADIITALVTQMQITKSNANIYFSKLTK